MDIDTTNSTVTDAASEILGKECRRKEALGYQSCFDHGDKKRDLKKRRYEAEG